MLTVLASIIPQEDRSSLSVRPQILRRSTSDGSLYLQRSLSFASSLGDDSRWANIHEQVNSRSKAIRDTLADSNIRLPRLPDLPNFNISEAISEFQTARKRSSSLFTTGVKRQLSPSKKQLEGGASHAQSEATAPIPASDRVSGMTRTTVEVHPEFTQALNNLQGDIVIVRYAPTDFYCSTY